MRRGGLFRQIILVALTAIAAVTIGRALRERVDQASTPTPVPTIVASPTSS